VRAPRRRCWWIAALVAAAVGCDPPGASDGDPEADEAPTAAAEPAPSDDPPARDPDGFAEDPVAAALAAAQLSSFGERRRLDDRTGARVRSAVRRRIGARPELITSRHYVRDDGGTVTIATFVAPYLERCVSQGTPREECLLSQGDGALATELGACVFGGIARIDVGPPRGEQEGALRVIGVVPLRQGEICAFEVESLQVRDEDRDDEPEIILGYAWSDLRHRGDERVVVDEGSERLVLRADLEEQVALTMRFTHHPSGEAEGDRNLVTQLRTVPRGGHPDLALDVIDWLADPCPEADPPRGRGEVCEMRERTVVYRYDRMADRWQPPEDPP